MLTATVPTEAAIDFESLKKAFENFDLATLFPKLDSVFGKITLICRVCVLVGPILLLILGLCYLFLAPKEANYYFGYRCYYGMGSVHAWRFTQRIAGMILGSLGLVLTIVMAVLSLGFAAMEIEAMVWRAVRCLVWEAVLSLLATLAINGLAMYWFDRKGELRRRPKKKNA